MSDNSASPEYRTVTEIRADEGNEGRTLEVTFARFNEFNEIYDPSHYPSRFMERLEPGAFEQTFAERGDRIRCLFNHGRDPAIGDKPLGQVTSLRETDMGPHGTVELLDREYVEDVRAGLLCDPPLYGASYRFGVVAEMWEDDPGVSAHNPKGIPERTISEVRVAEFGPVTFPADEGTNSLIGVRSLTERFAPTDTHTSTVTLNGVADYIFDEDTTTAVLWSQDRELSEPGSTTAGAPVAGTDTKRAKTATAFAIAQRKRSA